MKEKYLILRYSEGEDVKYSCFLVDGPALARGMFDWSGGREILSKLRHSRPSSADIYVTQLTWKEAVAVSKGNTLPPHPKWF